MKITHLSTAVLEANFDWILVKVETDAGVTGYGEAFVGPAVAAVIREFSSITVGEEAESIDRIMRRLKSSCVHASPGLVIHAIAGIECAVLDAVGKRHGMPLWQILGGKYRDSVPIYADCHAGEALESISSLLVPRTPHWMQTGDPAPRKSVVSLKHHGWDASGGDYLTPSAYARRAREMAARGFRMLKFDVDVPTPYETDEYNRALSRREVEYAAALIEAVYRELHGDAGLAVDCHWNYGVQAAVDLARALEPYHLLWLEDPIPPDNIPAFATIQRATSTTIATGENNYTRHEFLRLIREGELRLLAPDAQKIGFWEGKKIAEIAEMHHVNLSLHNISGPIGTMASVHLSAAIPNLLALEWHAASVPFFDALVKNAPGPLIREGRIVVPNVPGLGIELDEDVAWRYRKPGEPFFGQ